MTDAPLIKVGDAWERQRRGNKPGTYIVAVAGGVKFLLPRKNREEENGSTWTLFVTARSERRDPPTRGQATHEAASERAETWSPQQRERYTADLAAAFMPDEDL